MPMVSGLQRRRVPLTISVALVLVADAVALCGISALIVASSVTLSERLPHYFGLLAQLGETTTDWLGQVNTRRAVEEVLHPREAVLVVASLATDLVGILWDITLALIIAAFLLLRFGRIDGPNATTPGLLRTERARHTLHEVNRYIAVKTATSIATGLLIGAWIWVIDGEMPVLFGVLALLLNYIPNLGSVAAAVPAIALGFWGGGVKHGLLLMLGYGATNLIIGNIIEPRVMGRALGLWPVVILLSVILWGWRLGVVGALLSALLTVIVKMWLLGSEDLRHIGLMLGPRKGAALPEVELAAHDLLEEALPQTDDAEAP
jgi:predicted PurR-regulated permease PerM